MRCHHFLTSVVDCFPVYHRHAFSYLSPPGQEVGRVSCGTPYFYINGAVYMVPALVPDGPTPFLPQDLLPQSGGFTLIHINQPLTAARREVERVRADGGHAQAFAAPLLSDPSRKLAIVQDSWALTKPMSPFQSLLRLRRASGSLRPLHLGISDSLLLLLVLLCRYALVAIGPGP